MKPFSIAFIAALSLCSAAPVYANWFDAFMVGENHKKHLGSATTPTPDDLRAIGDSPYGEGKVYRYDPKTEHYHEVKDDLPQKSAVANPPAPTQAPPSGSK